MTTVEQLRAALANAGICAYDRDECTVTLALDTEKQVETLLAALPGKNRVRSMDAEQSEVQDA